MLDFEPEHDWAKEQVMATRDRTKAAPVRIDFRHIAGPFKKTSQKF
jgi:hypothetical protein